MPGHRRLWRGTLVFAYLRTLIGDDLGDGSRGKIERYGKMTVGTVDEGIGDGVGHAFSGGEFRGALSEFEKRVYLFSLQVIPGNYCEFLREKVNKRPFLCLS